VLTALVRAPRGCLSSVLALSAAVVELLLSPGSGRSWVRGACGVPQYGGVPRLSGWVRSGGPVVVRYIGGLAVVALMGLRSVLGDYSGLMWCCLQLRGVGPL